MNITSLKVIKNNPGNSEAVVGVIVGVIVGEKVALTYGDSLRIYVSFDCKSQGGIATLYGAIGVRGFGFDEKVKGEAPVPLPNSPTEFTPCVASVDILINEDIAPNTNYDIYVKFLEFPGAGMPEEDNVIDIVGIPPTYELLQHTIYPYAYIYGDNTEVSTATFKTDPFTPSAWAAQQFADALDREARKAGGKVLEVKVYVDTTPLLWTNYRIEVKGASPAGVGVAPGITIGIAPWLAILIIALAIIAVIVVATLAFKQIVALFQTKPDLHAAKQGWSKETLILTIHDSEEYWERPITPTATLEAMSEADVRDLLDEIAEEELPTGISWVPVAVIGVLGIVGVGAALAFSSRT